MSLLCAITLLSDEIPCDSSGAHSKQIERRNFGREEPSSQVLILYFRTQVRSHVYYDTLKELWSVQDSFPDFFTEIVG